MTQSEYQVGGSLPVNASTYVRRQADEDLFQGLKKGEFCYVLNSRQMGKSSLRVRTMQRLEAEGYACVAIDLTRIGSQQVTLEQWYAGMVRNIWSSLNLSQTVNVRRWWRDRDSLTPIQRLSEFLETVVLASISQPIVIFIDEIDSILSLNFAIDDFFALIRACYNQRVDHPAYQRLTFSLLGVATPSDLIQDKTRTPFNIGRAIELFGFKTEEAWPLVPGLAEKIDPAPEVLAAILHWTGGQPFLTQKVCKIVLGNAQSGSGESSKIDHPGEWVAQLVRSRIIENWEAQDEPEHLKTIRDRLLRNEQRAAQLLGVYQQILQQQEIKADDSTEHMTLRLSGLVVRRDGVLRVSNPIYGAIFNRDWVEKQLGNLRPYSEAIAAWLASDRSDESRLLRGKALQNAREWSKGKNLSDRDYEFLAASQELELREAQKELEAKRQALEADRVKKALEAEKKANQLLAQAQQKAIQRLRWGLVGLTIAALLAAVLIVWTDRTLKYSQKLLKSATRLERSGVMTWREFEAGGAKLDALVAAMQQGRELKALVGTNLPLQAYPAIAPLLSLQKMLHRIEPTPAPLIANSTPLSSLSFAPRVTEAGMLATGGRDGIVRLWTLGGEAIGQFRAHEAPIYEVAFSPDRKYLATASADGTARVWTIEGEPVSELKGHAGEIYSVRFSRDRQHLVTGGADGTLRIWRISGESEVNAIAHKASVRTVRFSPDGEYIVSAGDDGMARLWKRNGEPIYQWTGHQGPIHSASFSSNSQFIATGGADGTLRLWWNRSPKQRSQWKAHEGKVYRVSFSPDSEWLATAGSEGTAKVWDREGNLLAEYSHPQIRTLAFPPPYSAADPPQLATLAEDGTVQLWQIHGLNALLDRGCAALGQTDLSRDALTQLCPEAQPTSLTP